MKLTKRGRIVVGIFAALALFGLWEVSTHLWWVENGYCWGDALKCYK